MPPICTRFPETPATVNDPYFCRRRRAVSDLKTLKWLQGLAQGSPATISGHPTAVAPGHRRTLIKPRRTERTRINAHWNISTMFIAEAPSCERDLAHVVQCWDEERKHRPRPQRASDLTFTLTTEAGQIRAETPKIKRFQSLGTCL